MVRCFVVFFVLLFVPSFSSAVALNDLSVLVELDESGNAKVIEKYALSFSSDFEFEDFKSEVLSNSSSILTWQAKYDFFYPRFGSRAGKEIVADQIAFDEQTRVVSLSYFVNQFASLLSSSKRISFFNIGSNEFGAFNDAGIISIPENTTITIHFPSNAQVDTSSFISSFNFSNNKLTLSALKINSISLNYSIVKSIISSDNASAFSFNNVYVILLVAVFLFLFVHTQNETIEKKLESFIVKHSEIKKKLDDEIDL